jgi:isoquinoline 1-oxidoreductase subunit beta
VATAFRQIACDELGVPWDRVTVTGADTASIARVKATVGSDSIRDFALPLARACATLRIALARGDTGPVLAAQELPIEQLRSLANDRAARAPRAPLVHGREIVTGAPLYAADVRLECMLYARVLRSPHSPEIGSRPTQWDEEAARAVASFVAIVRDARLLLAQSDGLAVVARTPGALDRIEAALAVRWSLSREPVVATPLEQVDVEAPLRRGALQHVDTQGRLDAEKPWDVDLRLDVPLAAHAAMEPRAAVAHWDGRRLQVWAGTQDMFFVRDVIADALGLDAAAVVVHNQRIGGAFGGRTLCTVEREAAVLAHVLGRPVKVQWTRAQEFAHGFHRPPSSHRVRARPRPGGTRSPAATSCSPTPACRPGCRASRALSATAGWHAAAGPRIASPRAALSTA